jgi:D-alanyl-D-alanine carboxypeptidase
VTVEDLLDHRSGIFDVINDYKSTYTVSTDPTDATLQQVLDRPPVDEPGTVTRYTNPGFWLLGKIVERATSRPLAAELEERIFGPARMTSSTAGDRPGRGEGAGARVRRRGQGRHPGRLHRPWAAGGVVSDGGRVRERRRQGGGDGQRDRRVRGDLPLRTCVGGRTQMADRTILAAS